MKLFWIAAATTLLALPLFAVDGVVLNGTLMRPQAGVEITREDFRSRRQFGR